MTVKSFTDSFCKSLQTSSMHNYVMSLRHTTHTYVHVVITFLTIM